MRTTIWCSPESTVRRYDRTGSWIASANSPHRQGLRRVRLHDLRHLAATLRLTSGVPLPLVSKTLRHATSGIADLYGHLTAEAAVDAADSLGAVLDAAAAELANERAARTATARS